MVTDNEGKTDFCTDFGGFRGLEVKVESNDGMV